MNNVVMFNIILPRNCDYINTIRPYNPRYSYGILCIEELLPFLIDKFVLVACPYTKIKVRLLFDRDNIPNKFGIV